MNYQWCQQLASVLLLISVVGCGGYSTNTSTTDSADGEALEKSQTQTPLVANSQGAILYEQNCQSCHLPLATSSKRGLNADEIEQAIVAIPSMSAIALSRADIELIAIALSDAAPQDTGDNTSEASNLTSNSGSVENSSATESTTAIQALMQTPELNCTNSSCHDATPGSARLDLKTGELSQLAQRMVGQRSSSDQCAQELLIDPNDPDNSLLIKLIDPTVTNICMSKMPLGSNGVSPEALSTFRQWVDELIAAANLTSDSSLTDTSTNNVTVETVQHSPLILGRKLKYLLHGGALTNSELATLTLSDDTLDIDGLNVLLADWMSSDAYTNKIGGFLGLTLQQTPATERYDNQLNRLNNNDVSLGIRQNLRESFVRTALRIIDNNESFKAIITTNQWEVTTAVLTALAYADDDGRRRDDFRDIPFEASDFSDWRTITLTTLSPSPYQNSDFSNNSVPAAMRSLQSGRANGFRLYSSHP
jgi:hypothetical protein